MDLLKSLHILQKRAEQSVNQLVVDHSVVMVFKVLQNKQPKPLHSMFPLDYIYNTSQARSKSIKQTGHPSLDLWQDSFRWRAARSYNQLPASMKNLQSVEAFKLEAKKWVRGNIPVYGTNQD